MLDAGSNVLEIEMPGDDIAALREELDRHFSPSDALIARDDFRLPRLLG